MLSGQGNTFAAIQQAVQPALEGETPFCIAETLVVLLTGFA